MENQPNKSESGGGRRARNRNRKYKDDHADPQGSWRRWQLFASLRRGSSVDDSHCRRRWPSLRRRNAGSYRSSSSAAGCSNGGSQGLAVDGRESLVSRLMEIHDKSKELYNLTAEVENNYSVPCKAGNQLRSLARHFMEIHDKSEELYNLTAEVENNYSVPGKAGNQLRRLRRDLSVQVDPRPSDHELRWLRGTKRLHEYGGIRGGYDNLLYAHGYDCWYDH